METLKRDLVERCEKIQHIMQKGQIDACVVSSGTNLYYTIGKVISGYVVILPQGSPLIFQRRPSVLPTDELTYAIRKPEDILSILSAQGYEAPKRVALEQDTLSYSDSTRLQSAFQIEEVVNASFIMRQARSVKTSFEINLMRESSRKHVELYKKIPTMYTQGMTDYTLEIEVEHEARKMGSLGLFRIFGNSMEIFAGSVVAGENALAASPYDFALGGAGMHPSIPVGASGEPLASGQTVMVDVGGNFTGYMSDLSRVFAIESLPSELAQKAHRVSIEIHEELTKRAKPGVLCSELYNWVMEYVESQGLSQYFMGYTQKAAFIGHGVGIEINELPILSARSKDVLQKGMVLAIEPKFTIPHVGALGVEDTYLVNEDGLELLTKMNRELVILR